MAEDETKQSGGVDLTQTIPLDHLPATLRRRLAGRRLSRRWRRRAASPSKTYIGRSVHWVCEAPDDKAATALSLSVCSRGNVRSQTLRAFSFDEMKTILSKMV
jgi:hypothetical protein